MKLLTVLILCIFDGGDQAYSSVMRSRKESHHRPRIRRARLFYPGPERGPGRPGGPVWGPGREDDDAREESVLLDYYQEAQRPSDFHRQGGFRRQILPPARRRKKTTPSGLPSSEEARYGRTMFAWRGPPVGGRLETYIYDPTAGYEPYWIDGHWFIAGVNATTTLGPNCIYAECPPAYVAFGPVCAMHGRYQLKSFDTYCDMLLADCNFEYRTTWMVFEDVGGQNHGQTHHVAYLAEQVLQGCLHKVRTMNRLKVKIQYHPAFETGFLVCRIQERYRQMVDRATNVQSHNRRSSIEHVIFLEEIEEMYWEITHLVGMLHEIERKYRVELPMNQRYRETSTTTRTRTTKKTRAYKKPTKAPLPPGVTKVSRKPKKSTPFNFEEFFAWTTTRGKTPRWKFRLWDYGWELQYDWWNIHPSAGRQRTEEPRFYRIHPLPRVIQ